MKIILLIKEHIDSVHEGPKQFRCKICASRFSRKSSLNKHFREFHSQGKEKVHICDICNKRFDDTSKLKNHIAYIHENNTKCTICGQNFRFPEYLRIHIMSVHQGKTIPTKAADEIIQIGQKNIPNKQIVSFPKPTEKCL